MAKYFGQDEALFPLTPADQITDPAQTAIRLSGSTKGNLSFQEFSQTQFPKAVQTDIPETTEPVALYSVQTGPDRGLYYNTGTQIIKLLAFDQDGAWPVTA